MMYGWDNQNAPTTAIGQFTHTTTIYYPIYTDISLRELQRDLVRATNAIDEFARIARLERSLRDRGIEPTPHYRASPAGRCCPPVTLALSTAPKPDAIPVRAILPKRTPRACLRAARGRRPVRGRSGRKRATASAPP